MITASLVQSVCVIDLFVRAGRKCGSYRVVVVAVVVVVVFGFSESLESGK